MCQCQHYKSDHIGATKIINGKKAFRFTACSIDECLCYQFRLHTGVRWSEKVQEF